MQKQSMTRVAASIGLGGVSNKNNPYKDVRLGKDHPGRKPAVRWGNTGNPDGYGQALISSPRYRAYKRKRNRRARAANGGTLPTKFA